MRTAIRIVVAIVLLQCVAAAMASSDYPGVSRLQISTGSVVVADSPSSNESTMLTANTQLENPQVSYFQYASPTPGGAHTTYFIYAKPVILTFACRLMADNQEILQRTETFELELEPGILYVAKPLVTDGNSGCRTAVRAK